LAVAVVVALAAVGCTGSDHQAAHARPGATTTTTSATTVDQGSGATQTATATSRGLDVTLTVTPAGGRAGVPVGFAVTAHAGRAVGALGYQLSYGDGSTAENPVPAFCVAGNGSASQAAWTLTHTYVSPGTYTASVHVYINCGGVDVITSVPVTVAIA
jgi:hypothetical protein